MKSHPSDHECNRGSEPTETERVAAEWILRQAQGFTANDERELTRWLAEDPRHARLLAEMEETSRLLDGMKFRLPQESLAVAAPVPPAPPVRRRRYLRAVVGLAAAVALGLGIWRYSSLHGLDYAAAASTRLGEFKRMELPDGSVLMLNTNTAVEVSYESAERRVRLLSGEAYFAVAKNPARPFIVQAGRIAVRAVGTAFDVRLHPNALSVLVTEGRVRVSGGEPQAAVGGDATNLGPELGVGHMARLALDTDRAPAPEGMVVTPVEPRIIRNTLAWQEGRLEFFETPLSEVVTEFNRYNRNKIIIADPVLASRRFGGAFASHQAEPFLELLEQSFGVVAEQHGNETIIRQAK